MPSFRYRAITPDGQARAGLLDGASAAEVLDQVRRSGLIPIETVESRAPSPARGKLDGPSRKALIQVVGELGVLLGAGLTLDRALGVCIDSAPRPKLKAALQALHKRVREGAPLSRAIAEEEGLLPPIAAAMTEAGEVNGRLDQALNRLAATLDRAEALRSTVASAMVYPAVLFALAGAVIGMMLLFVVPQFETLFSDQGARLPLATRIVVGASEGLRHYGVAGALALAGAVIGLRAWLSRPATRRLADAWVLRTPLIGPLVRAAETARFARVLGSLVEAGVVLPSALAIAGRTIANSHMAQAVDGVVAGLKRGGGLSGPLAATGVFPPSALSFLRTGEETAQLGLMLERLADLLDREVRTAVEALIALLTPVITIAMGAIVAGIIASVMSAILGFNDLALPT